MATGIPPSRQQWDAVKGVLIVCVVVGHSVLANVVLPPLKDVLYSCHVQVFLLLPFLYGIRPMSGKNVMDIGVRCLVPYSVFVVACSVLLHASTREPAGVWLHTLARGLLTGNDVYLKDATGLYLFWFLPVMMWVSLLGLLYYSCPSRWRWGLLGVFAACHVLLPALSWSARRTYPWFGTHVALYIVGLGVAARFLWQRAGYQRIRQWRYVALAGCAVCFVVMLTTGSAVTLSHLSCPSFRQPDRILLHDAIPILVCLTLAGFSGTLVALPSLAYVGKRSLPVYLMHQPCMIAFTAVCTRCMSQPQTAWGLTGLSLVSVIVALAGPLVVMYVLDALPRLKRVLFPRNIEDIVGSRWVSATM